MSFDFLVIRFKVLLFALDYHVGVLTMPMWGPISEREREREIERENKSLKRCQVFLLRV